MRVLHVCESVKGGISTYLNLLLQGLNKKNVQNLVLLPNGDQKFLRINHDNIVLFNKKRSLLGLIRFYKALLITMKDKKPDLIYAHSTFSGVIVCFYKIFHPSTKVIYCSHGWSVFRSQNFLKKCVIYFTELVMSYIPNLLINISRYEHSVTRFIGYSKKSILIENSVCAAKEEVDSSRDDSDDKYYLKILFVGRFDQQKGIDILLDALLEHNQEFEEKLIKLYLIGDYVLEENHILSLDHFWIEQVGWVDNEMLDSYYKKADFLVVPSRWEGFGLVVLEAYRNHLPVLVSTSGALPFIVEDCVTGRIFEPNKNSLKEILSTINLDERDAMSKNAFNKYQKQYSPERFVDKQYNCIIDLFNS